MRVTGLGITRAIAVVGLGLGKVIGIRTVGVVEGIVEGIVVEIVGIGVGAQIELRRGASLGPLACLGLVSIVNRCRGAPAR